MNQRACHKWGAIWWKPKAAFTLRACSSVIVKSVSIETVAVVGAKEIRAVLLTVTDAERALINIWKQIRTEIKSIGLYKYLF